ncbi:MAG: type II secretion system protein GspF [Rhodocyclaceae bacterium]|jgi:general secretion pathway protein F|nr:type II secretion system protein GspF [Rhodocyclaceae bacterium]
MQRFRFEAITYDGQTEKGVVESDAIKSARQQLLARGLVPISVELDGAGAGAAGVSGLLFKRKGISATDLAVITKQFALLVRSGLPLDEALRLLAEESPKQVARDVLAEIVHELQSGVPLSRALASQPATFDTLYQSVVAAAEHSGLMAPVLTQFATFLEKRQAMKQKVVAAMVYPVMLIAVSFLVMTVLMVYVIPQVTRVFESTRQKLPLTTEIVMSISSFLAEWGWLLVVAVLGLVWVVRHALQNPSVRLDVDSRALSMPVIGPLILAYETARFANTMSMLVAANVPILSALRSARDTLRNSYLRSVVDAAEMRVREGSTLARALGAQGVFSPLFIHMIRSGEATGQLADMLRFGADNAEVDAEQTTRVFTSILEPAMILLMGVMVLFIVMAVMQPILEMNAGIR